MRTKVEFQTQDKKYQAGSIWKEPHTDRHFMVVKSGAVTYSLVDLYQGAVVKYPKADVSGHSSLAGLSDLPRMLGDLDFVSEGFKF